MRTQDTQRMREEFAAWDSRLREIEETLTQQLHDARESRRAIQKLRRAFGAGIPIVEIPNYTGEEPVGEDQSLGGQVQKEVVRLNLNGISAADRTAAEEIARVNAVATALQADANSHPDSSR